MPVVLESEDFAPWLNDGGVALLKPAANDVLNVRSGAGHKCGFPSQIFHRLHQKMAAADGAAVSLQIARYTKV
jgi:hypothetical protein